VTPAQETVYAVASLLKERPIAELFVALVAITRAATELLARTEGADVSKVLRAAFVLREMLDADATRLTTFTAEYHARGAQLAVAWAETECGIDETNEAIEKVLA
jgi:hypothetical protein